MANGNVTNRITVDLGPATLIMLSELILITLKMLEKINVSWLLVLSPIVVVLGGASLILLLSLLSALRKRIF